MAAKRKGHPAPDRRYILVIDIGGTHVKFRIGAHGAIRKFDSGPKMTPARMTRRLRELLGDQRYDAVSAGYPGLVFHGRIAADPHNLGTGWVGYDFAAALGRPVHLINDAAMQAIGSYRGGRMLFLGLGTGLGATLIVDGIVEPTELGHMPYKHGKTFEDYLGERGRKRLGNHRWRKTVCKVIADLSAAFEADYIVLGGGNARRLKKLPRGVRLGSNLHAFIGGLRLWDPRSGIVTSPSSAVRAARARR
ncbi:MAG TPA: ROK family protein [Steroidobacteraceae bacterium]|jgi:polyphosphate glucokinase|nr:ROK family protein [Steroidobacteraceae bacterium]